MAESLRKLDVLVIGGGLAGAATAFHFARTGRWNVLLFEMEPTPGQHASGRNAAMIRQAVTPEPLAALARRGAAALADWSSRRGLPVTASFSRSGSILWGKEDDLAELERCAPSDSRRIGRDDVLARFPGLPLPPDSSGIWTPSDGLLDVAAWNHFFLHGIPGVKVLLNARVESGERLDNGRWELKVNGRDHTGDVVVNAAGAWSDRVALRLGAEELRLVPKRRHLFHTGPLDWVDPRWPFFWDVTEGLYFRPESGGLLLSACDEDVSLPVDAAADPRVVDLLARKLARLGGRIADLPIAKSWAGLRTFADDHSFVIGPDGQQPGLFRVAALGGHGVTTSYAVGELACAIIEGREAVPAAFSPARLRRE